VAKRLSHQPLGLKEGFSMRVILDTNIFLQDIPLESPAFVTFLSGLRPAGYELIVPQLVYDELINKYIEEYSKFLELGRKLGINPHGPIRQRIRQDASKAAEEYAKYLQTKLPIKKLVDYPSTPHNLLVRRALARRKPFRNTDTGGYRDALLWDTIIILAQEIPQSPIAFITSNQKDFSAPGQPQKLHSELIQDLTSVGKPVSEVRLFNTLTQFVDENISPVLQSLSQIRDQLSAGTYPDLELKVFVEEELQGHVGWMEINHRQLGFPSEYETSHLSMVNRIDSIESTNVRQLPTGELLVEFNLQAECEFDVFIAKSDFYALDDEESPYVWDNDWNEWYVAAEESSDVEMHINLIYDPNIKKVKTAEITDINPTVEWWERQDRERKRG
jgi:predicted nucleic acid-binding protein